MPANSISDHEITGKTETGGERFANAASAAIGIIAVLGFAPFLLAAARQSANPWAPASAGIFGASVIALYLASTLYHSVPPGPRKDTLRLCDHSAIFLLIAGTYTPFALGPLRNNGGWTLLWCEWILAGLGIIFKFSGGIRYSRLSSLVYLAMGWLGIFWFRPFLQHAHVPAGLWLLAGGAAYTGGVVFYVAKRRRYAHFVWHLFVLVGTACHAYAVWRYAF